MPERKRVSVRLGAVIDRTGLERLEDEAFGLLEREFAELTIDLRTSERLAVGTAATLAAIGRRVRLIDARVWVLEATS